MVKEQAPLSDNSKPAAAPSDGKKDDSDQPQDDNDELLSLVTKMK